MTTGVASLRFVFVRPLHLSLGRPLVLPVDGVGMPSSCYWSGRFSRIYSSNAICGRRQASIISLFTWVIWYGWLSWNHRLQRKSSRKPFHDENHTGKIIVFGAPVYGLLKQDKRYSWALDYRRWQDWRWTEGAVLWWDCPSLGLSCHSKGWQNTTLSKMTALSLKVSTSLAGYGLVKMSKAIYNK